MAHRYVEVQHEQLVVEHEVRKPVMDLKFPNRDLSDEREMTRLLSNTAVLPVCLPFPTFDDSENPDSETRLTATDLLEMVSREVTCPEYSPRYCPIKSAFKGVLNFELE